MLLMLLVFGHFLADFGLQNEYVALNKTPGKPAWFWCMSAHCSIHALIVCLITGSDLCAVVEFFSHYAIDCFKCKRYIGYNTDQCLHLSFKALYFIFMYPGILNFCR